MFSPSRLKLSIIICYEKNITFSKKEKSVILLKKALRNTIFKVIYDIFKQYLHYHFMNYVNHSKVKI